MWKIFKAKDYEFQLKELIDKIVGNRKACRMIIEDGAKWYGLTIIWCCIAIISIIINFIQLIW